MRLFEIVDVDVDALPGLQEPPQGQPDYATGRLTDEEFKVAYDKLQRSEMSKEEIQDFANEVVSSGQYPRSAGSLVFVMNRMHILLHGLVPEGESANRAEIMFRDTQPMINYVVGRGHLSAEDIHSQIQDAREELEQRPSAKPKIKREDAMRMMGQYFMANKARIPKNVTQYREQIIQDIMNNVSPEEAFSKYM